MNETPRNMGDSTPTAASYARIFAAMTAIIVFAAATESGGGFFSL